MAFSPASDLAPVSVAILGTVDVSDRVGRVLGDVTVANASLAVTGPLTDAQLAARLPLSVTGPLTDAQLAARLPLNVSVGNFPATQPVSVASLPLPSGAATEATLVDVESAANDVAVTAILQRDKLATHD